MSDAARDLYSFLRSKDFISEDEAEQEASNGSEEAPTLRAVDEFNARDESASAQDASSGNASDGRAANGQAAKKLKFEDGIGEKLHTFSDDELDKAPFGIIRVSDEGEVEFFNRYESQLSGVDPSDAIGANFFTQVAPCSNNRIFRGRFKEGVRKGELDEKFTYTYTYKMKPTLVDVRLRRDDEGNNWILVQKR